MCKIVPAWSWSSAVHNSYLLNASHASYIQVLTCSRSNSFGDVLPWPLPTYPTDTIFFFFFSKMGSYWYFHGMGLSQFITISSLKESLLIWVIGHIRHKPEISVLVKKNQTKKKMSSEAICLIIHQLLFFGLLFSLQIKMIQQILRYN